MKMKNKIFLKLNQIVALKNPDRFKILLALFVSEQKIKKNKKCEVDENVCSTSG